MRLAARALTRGTSLALACWALPLRATALEDRDDASAMRPKPSISEATDDRPRVLLEVHAESQGMLPLLRAELDGLGLEVVERSNTEAPASPLAAERDGRVERFRVVIKPDQVEVWVHDVHAKTVVHHEVFAKTDGSPLATRTAVLHAVELLGWSLRERLRHNVPTAARSAAATARSAAATPQSKDSRESSTEWLVTVTPLVLHSPGGTDPGGGAALDVTCQRGIWGLRLLGGASLWPHELRRTEGAIQVTPRWIGLEGVAVARLSSRLRLSAGAGLNVVSMSFRGRTDRDLQAHEDHFLTVAPRLDARSFYAFGDSIALGLSAAALAPLRSDVMLVDDEAVGRYGRVIFTLGLGVEAALR